MNTNNRITIVIVLYNSSNIIFECLKFLSKFKIIIVDNGKNSVLLNQLRKKNNIKIVSKNKNLGFGNAINFAYEFVETEFFLVLNPDIEINENSISILLNTATNYENCAIAAPLNVPDEDSYGILPEKKIIYQKNQKKYHSQLNKEKIYLEGEICVDVTKGCALLINSKYFKQVGLFSKKYFLFWEEIDLCRKFLSHKLSIIVNPSALAYHRQGKSSKLSLKNFFIRCLHSEISPLYYFNIKKNSPHLYKNIMRYIFRSITYLLILNIKNSIKNFAKLSANIIYILK